MKTLSSVRINLHGSMASNYVNLLEENKASKKKNERFVRACLRRGGGPQVGEVTRLGGVTRLFI